MRYFTQLLRQSGAMIGASGPAEPAGLRMSQPQFVAGGSLFAGREPNEPLFREVDEERIVAREGGEVAGIERFAASAGSSESVEVKDASAAASITPSVNTPTSAASNASSPPGAPPTTNVAHAAPERKPDTPATKSHDLASVQRAGNAPARQQIETANAGDYSIEGRRIDSLGSLLEQESSLDAREREFARALADARAWVSTTPSSDEVNALVEWDARKLNAEGPAVARDAAVQFPGPASPEPLTQDLHLTIGTIEVIMEGPPAAPIAAVSPPRPVGTRRADATSMSRRLARHHLRG